MLNVTEAAHASGKSRTTLYRHIKAGKLSAEPDPGGGYIIDPAELIRVYGPLKNAPERSPDVTSAHDITPEKKDDTVIVAREEYDRMREAMAKIPLLEANLNDLRRMLPAAPHEVKPDEESQPEAGRIRKAWRVLRGK